MRQIILLFCLLPLTAGALDRVQIDHMLISAAAAKGKSYIEARQNIIDLGTEALPLLAQAATDPKLTWQQRLVARICYEKMTRGEDIEALRRYDWRTHPQYDKQWEKVIVGVKVRLGTIVIPKSVEAGLWYYYIELAWKDTEEYAIEPFNPVNDARILSESWLGWCMDAVQGIRDDLARFPMYRELIRLGIRGQPERYHLTQALIERLELDPTLSNPLNVECYRFLLNNKETNAVPVLVKTYDAYSKHELQGPEAFPGRHNQLYRGMFGPILEIANAHHADLIEKFVGDHSVLASLTNNLPEIRARSAPPAVAEPPFRLGQRLVKP
jgi:hypothetical protein